MTGMALLHGEEPLQRLSWIREVADGGLRYCEQQVDARPFTA